MISGIYWLAILMVIIITLFAVALLLTKRKKLQRNAPSPIKLLHRKLINNIDEYNFALNKNHITVVNDNQKIAMITLDDKQKVGQRKFGDVIILNFHKPPNHQQVLEQLPKT